MTYDILLWRAGVSAAEIDLARPDRLAAARFAVFAERVAPLIDDAENVLARDFDKGMSPRDRSRLGAAKIEAKKQIAAIRSHLYLDPPDG